MPKPPPESPDAPSRPLPPQTLEGLQPAGLDTGGLERAPIQNSPWKETSLDHPYEKPRKSSEPGSESRSGGGKGGPGAGGIWGGGTVQETPILRVMVGGMSPSLRTPEPLDGGIPAADLSPIPPISSSPASTPQDGPSESSPASCYVVPVRNVAGQRQGRISAPATPEMQGRRGQSQPLR